VQHATFTRKVQGHYSRFGVNGTWMARDAYEIWAEDRHTFGSLERMGGALGARVPTRALLTYCSDSSFMRPLGRRHARLGLRLLPVENYVDRAVGVAVPRRFD
jgi:hypothetical protein